MSQQPLLSIKDASLAFGEHTLWTGLDLEVQPHEFIAVIGSNGSGKSSLLKAILGQQELTGGQILMQGKPIASRKVGYIPQSRAVDPASTLRACDLIGLGLDGHRFGIPLPSRAKRQAVARTLEAIGASELAKTPITKLSGGELQRMRVGQAVISEPDLILADEPLSALDLHQQQVVSALIDDQRRAHNAAVLFVTHDVNPILDLVDRVLYLANGKFRIGTADEVLRSEVLSELYGTQVDVVRNQGRIVVLGTQDHDHHPEEEWK